MSVEHIAELERAIVLEGSVAVHHIDLCELYRRQARLEDALRHGLRGVVLAPDNPDAHYNLGLVYTDRVEIDLAAAAMKRALLLDPNKATAHFELAELQLLAGQFEAGWRGYEWRWKLPGVKPLLPPGFECVPLWNGQPMGDRPLLLIADQGFGDTIQFARYIPLVAARCPNLIVAGSSEIQPIVCQQPGITHYFSHWGQQPRFDEYCPLSSLPFVFGTNLSNIPARIPYIRANAQKAAYWRGRLNMLVPDGYRRIGLVWAGRPTHRNDFNRSIPLQTFAPLLKRAGIAFIALRMEGALAQIGSYFGRAPLFNFGAELADFNDTMAVIDALDHLITVDTSVAHLAGAMGKPASVLLSHAHDWRWLMNRIDTPWYPTVKLVRQDSTGDWASAMRKLNNTL